MGNDPGAGIVGILAGAGLASLIACGSLILASAARPHLWLQILVLLWAIPLVLAGFTAGREIVHILLGRYFIRGTSWHWLDHCPEVELRKSNH
jgi:hypothetical protein